MSQLNWHKDEAFGGIAYVVFGLIAHHGFPFSTLQMQNRLATVHISKPTIFEVSFHCKVILLYLEIFSDYYHLHVYL